MRNEVGQAEKSFFCRKLVWTTRGLKIGTDFTNSIVTVAAFISMFFADDTLFFLTSFSQYESKHPGGNNNTENWITRPAAQMVG